MPIYMDRHDVSEEVTAETVAGLHQKDLEIQDEFQCKGLTYWFDAKRKTAFCLVEAPNKDAIQDMHNHAHGSVPHRIIEVDAAIVESFLGRIEDPKKSRKTELNIINDPAFRSIMVIKFQKTSLQEAHDDETNNNESQIVDLLRSLEKFKARIVKQKPDYFLTSFESVTQAVLCALEIQQAHKKSVVIKHSNPFNHLHLGISAGIPVSEKDGFFEETIEMAERLCDIAKDQIAISSEVKDLYESENINSTLDPECIKALSSSDEKFLSLLMDFIEKDWRNPDLKVSAFNRNLGYSKSQLYRKMISITGMSPNNFLKEYRLNSALKLLNKKSNTISEVAFEIGFNTPAYFSKCFQEAFGILPSLYLKS